MDTQLVEQHREQVFRRVETHCENGHRLSFFLPEEAEIYQVVSFPNKCPICESFYPDADISIPRRSTYSIQLDPFLHPFPDYRTNRKFYLTLRNSDGRWVRTFKPLPIDMVNKYIDQLADLPYEEAVVFLLDEKAITAKELKNFSWPLLALPHLETR